MTRKSSRRDFLRGKAAARAVADAAQSAFTDYAGPTQSPADGSAASSQDRGYLLQVSREAMACEFEVSLNAGEYPNGMDTALEALDEVDAMESRLSIFRDESELAEVNRFAADGPVEVSEGLFRLLEISAQLYQQTGGAFDVSTGPLSDVWGFSRREGRIPSDAELAAALDSVGMENVVLDDQDKTVAFSRPGVRLNLGAIGKGYALDRCGAVFEAAKIENFIIHGGQSSVLAHGSSVSTRPPSAIDDEDSETHSGVSGWTVGVSNPLRPGRRLAEIRLRDRALATSGSAKQFFRYKGRRYSHILDPRNGQPASEGVLSATVLAPTATLADALSTAVFVLGPERSRELLDIYPEIGCIIVASSGGVKAQGGRGEKIVHFGLDERDFRLF